MEFDHTDHVRRIINEIGFIKSHFFEIEIITRMELAQSFLEHAINVMKGEPPYDRSE